MTQSFLSTQNLNFPYTISFSFFSHRHFIDTGIPKQALDKKVKSVCHNIQNTVDPEDCIRNLDLLGSDIFTNFEAQSVCASLDLCQSEPADVVEILSDMDAFKLHEKIQSVLMLIEVKDTVPKDECQECVKTIADAEKQLPNQYSQVIQMTMFQRILILKFTISSSHHLQQEEFTQLLQEQCEEVDASQKKQCMAFCVKLAKMIYDGADPKAVCKFLHKC